MKLAAAADLAVMRLDHVYTLAALVRDLDDQPLAAALERYAALVPDYRGDLVELATECLDSVAAVAAVSLSAPAAEL